MTKKRAVVLGFAMIVACGFPSWLRAQEAEGQAERPDVMPYTLAPGDVLTVSVWKSEDLGGVVPVRPDGRISLPLIGEVEVIGRTPEEIRLLLVEKYKGYVTAPVVSVVVSQINSWKIYVLGEVRSPGAYDVVSRTTVLQAIAMAGGLTEFAKESGIVLLRNVGGHEEIFSVSIKAITSGRDPGQNVVLGPGDTIVVP